jgi:hypothetical protein
LGKPALGRADDQFVDVGDGLSGPPVRNAYEPARLALVKQLELFPHLVGRNQIVNHSNP